MGQTKKWLTIFLICLFLITGGCATAPSLKTGATKPPYHARIVAVGDVHGNYDGLVSILRETSLINEMNRWVGGTTLLVQTGDLLDRGVDVRKVMDLLMSLEKQAKTAGGKVVVLMGNHEAMNLFGSLHDVNPDVYKSFATSGSMKKQTEAFERWWAFFGGSSEPEEKSSEERKLQWMTEHPPGFVEYTEAMAPDGVYGKWIRNCPVMFRYGGSVFLHAGISQELTGLTPLEVNRSIAADIEKYDRLRSLLMGKGMAAPFFSMTEIAAVAEGILTAAEKENLSQALSDIVPQIKEYKPFLDTFFDASPLMVDEGPLWFRGYAMWTEEQLEPFVPEWLKANSTWRVIVSHTPRLNGRIQSRMNGSIFLIDTGMLSSFYKGGRPSALEIRDDDVTAVYEAGERVSFPSPAIDYYGPPLVWKDAEGNPLPFNSQEEIEQFLLTAQPASVEIITIGVNRPQKILLEKNGRKINAIFRYQCDAASPDYQSAGRRNKPRYFKDCYQGEISAYVMNRHLGLDNMAPTVYRTIDGRQGTLQLWAEGVMPDRERAEKNILPPESLPWNRQMWDMRVFDNLINNVDRNQTNILIDPNWRLIPIDHTQSFARDKSLPKPEQVIHCSRGLWHALRHIDENETRSRLSEYLAASEIDALFVRREKLVQLIRDLIMNEGEENILVP